MREFLRRRGIGVLLAAAMTVVGGAGNGLLGACGPFTDAAADSFCPFVLEIFYLGITTGTTPTTFDPTSNVTRLQMAAFLSRTVDGALKRGSRRAALDQFWTTQGSSALGLTTLPAPLLVASDGSDLWVSNLGAQVSRVRASDGKLLETWTASTGALYGIVPAMGRVFAVSSDGPGVLARLDPSQPAGAMSLVASNLGNGPIGLAFDGSRFWTANSGNGGAGSVSIVTPGATIPWTVTTVTAGFAKPFGAVFDGANVWITDSIAGTLLKLDAAGAVLQTVTVGPSPVLPVFDGSNLWVPVNAATFPVVRASTGAVIGNPSNPSLAPPLASAFDGQRIMITGTNGMVGLWKAADLTSLGFFSTGGGSLAYGVASDGVNFWIALNAAGKLARF